ncbi:flavin reductase family protein [Nocardioides sp. NPDC051685]|uniref:flavin reductase family protein n=1 Tax=Nocardioides sp. NPDC051685 TaxID=3364334 RepID=UPI00379A0CAF
MSSVPATQVAPRHFRDVLGELPTGVVAITTRSVDDGLPIGMTVGSFTSVSLDPPLVAFLPARSSSTFPLVRETGRFCANILASGQEAVGQKLATKGQDRFADVPWHPAPGTGAPIIDGALAWVDCEIVDVYEAGDHDIVIGRVHQLEFESRGTPLVFYEGGYGTFTLRSLVLATRGRLNEFVTVANDLRPELEQLSQEFGVECRVFAREEDALIVVMTTGYDGPADRVGMVVPFSPPFGMSFAAWGTSETRTAWYDASPQTLSPEERSALDAQLDNVRLKGCVVSYANEPTLEIAVLLEDMAQYGHTPRFERQLKDAGRELAAKLSALPDLDSTNVGSVRSIQVPVLRGEDDPVLHLSVSGFKPDSELAVVQAARDRLVEITTKASMTLRG